VSRDDRHEEFIVPATDAHGHSSRQWFTCSPGHARETDVILAAKRFPYRTKGDLFRHALDRHLSWLHEQDGNIPSVRQQIEVVKEVVREAEFQEDFLQTFELMSPLVSRLISENRENEARGMVLRVRHHISQMPDTVHRDRYLMELKTRWGYLLKTDRLKLITNEDT